MILITGSNGFIGKNLVLSLEEETHPDHSWHGIDVWTCDYAKADLHPDELFKWLETNHPSVIIHLGAITDTTHPANDRLINTNVNYTLELYDICKKYNIRLIYASSAATYGGGENGYYDDDNTEYLHNLAPLNPYADTKAMVDHRIFKSIDKGGGKPPQLVGLKFFNVYGPHEEHKGHMRSIISRMHAQISASEPVLLFESYKEGYEDGEQLRDFVHVEDCCKVIRWLMNNRDVNGIFNVGTGKAESFNTVADSVFNCLGEDLDVVYIPMPDSIKNQYQYHTEAPMTKLRGAGYKDSFIGIEEGVDKYIKFLSSNE